MSLNELETNEKLKFWYQHIQNQRNSGLTVTRYCEQNNLTVSVYYAYQKRIKQLLCDELNSQGQSSALVPFLAVPKIESKDTIIITKGNIKVEFTSDTSYSNIESIIKALLC